MSIRKKSSASPRWMILPVLLLPLMVAGAEPRSGYSDSPHLSKQSRQPLGEDTREWLRLQASGAKASDTDHSLPSGVRSRIYQRYLDSFEHPIPELFFDTDQRATRR
ncbi:DUF3613 domain-containing protein [Methylonatrum kenyense]|uniref:DUF3613 domain-containing protein n=1 Tax=Methylonatrum kenyense TaxID=455253 RepID=UPI0020BDB28C|nr:DUF3613 domain-containing protein [Methylonatrum kenyense]MCK8515207.1 DUF3613 domain-containing protein [Methylonatrum kenyense]